MPYVVGVSFSNVQNSFDAPAYFVGFAIESSRHNELSVIKTKENLQEKAISKNPFDLSAIEDEIKHFENFTVRSNVIKLTKNKSNSANDLSFILGGFLKAIESIKSTDLRVASEGFEKCYLHVPLDSTGKKELSIEDLSYFSHPISKYKINFQKKGEFAPILELARLGTWLEYMKMLRKKQHFINKQIVGNTNFQFLQFCRIVWNSPPIDSYSNDFVGYPRMILKTTTGTTDIVMRPEQELNFLPIIRACSGCENGFDAPRCKCSSVRQPFGNLLMNDRFEKCQICSKYSIGSRCLTQRAKCDGKEMECQDKKFIGNVCHSEFCIYVTLYGNKLKVGRGMEARIIGRLLEQGAFDALIFYPIPWLPFADHLEETLTKILKSQTSRIKIADVDQVSERVTYEERLENIASLSMDASSKKKRDEVYNRVVEILVSTDSAEANYLLALERRKVCFEKNWIGWKTNDFDQSNFVRGTQFKSIKGRVNGVIGSFAVIGNKTYDTSKMEGYIIGFPNK